MTTILMVSGELICGTGVKDIKATVFALRNSFTSKRSRLLFLPNGPKKQWVCMSDAVWSGPRSMTSKIAIEHSYPSFEAFFTKKLGVPNASPSILAAELKVLAKRWKGKAIFSKAVKAQISDTLLDISGIIDHGEGDTSTPPDWLRTLRNDAIFPVESHARGLTLYSANDVFYVPDVGGKYKGIFGGRVPLLSLSENQHFIQPLLDSEVFRSRIRYLANAVGHSSVASGPRILNTAITLKYCERAGYMER